MSCPNIDMFGRYLMLSDGSLADCHSEQRATMAAQISISLYPVPSLGLPKTTARVWSNSITL